MIKYFIIPVDNLNFMRHESLFSNSRAFINPAKHQL